MIYRHNAAIGTDWFIRMIHCTIEENSTKIPTLPREELPQTHVRGVAGVEDDIPGVTSAKVEL